MAARLVAETVVDAHAYAETGTCSGSNRPKRVLLSCAPPGGARKDNTLSSILASAEPGTVHMAMGVSGELGGSPDWGCTGQTMRVGFKGRRYAL